MLELWSSPIRDSQAVQVLLVAVAVLTLADVVFGLVNAVTSRSFSSQKMREGIRHKSSSFLLVFIGLVADVLIASNIDIGVSAPVLMTVCVYLSLMEISSLMETALSLNPELEDSKVFQFLKGVGKDA